MHPFAARLTASARPSAVLRGAFASGGLPPLPALSAMPDIPAGPAAYHSGSVLGHVARVMDAVAGDPLAVWMAFVHDAGKLETPPEILPHHYGHEARGEALAGAWGRLLDVPQDMEACGRLVAREHMKAGRYRLVRPGTRYDLLLAVAAHGEACMAAFWKLADADSRSDVSRDALADWARLRAFLEARGAEAGGPVPEEEGPGGDGGLRLSRSASERLRQEGIRVLMNRS